MSLLIFFGYICLCLLLSFIQISLRKNITIINIVAVLLYFLIISFRDINSTADTLNYVEDFNTVTLHAVYNMSNVDTLHNFEYGYTLLTQLIKFFIGDNIPIFLGIIAVIQSILIFYGTRNYLKVLKTDNVRRIVLFMPFFTLYVSIFGFMYNAVVLRAGIAIALIYFGISLIINKRYVLGIVFTLISLLMHNTSFLGFGVFIFFKKTKIKKKVYYIVVLFTFLLYLLKVQEIISNLATSYILLFIANLEDLSFIKLTRYLEKVRQEVSSYSFLIIVNFIVSIVMLKYSNINTSFNQRLININIFFLISLSLLSAIPTVSRALDFYMIFNLLYFYLCLFSNYDVRKGLVFVLIVLSYSIYFYRLAVLPFM
ncbi:EpsG family protein [Pontibacter cellulosilyticus]|uniref:EpsG family protein n=1 Tax=Pontibacter cellulosilyticus TaxID=1720253 RepID=A0A923NBD0_9BACT|nr:EpsG family protein [Pontibacter cellulosilyticus]